MSGSRDVAALLELVNEQPNYHNLLARLPLQEFVSMQCWPSLRQRLRQQLFIWLFRPPMRSTALTVNYDASLALSMGQLHNLHSGILSVGYLIELPRNYRTELTPSYISSVYGNTSGPIGAVEDLPELEHLLNGQHLSVFVLGNAQIIAAIRKDMVDFLH